MIIITGNRLVHFGKIADISNYPCQPSIVHRLTNSGYPRLHQMRKTP